MRMLARTSLVLSAPLVAALAGCGDDFEFGGPPAKGSFPCEE